MGNQTSRQLADGHSNTSQYDTMNRLQRLSYFDGTSVVYAYTTTGQPQTVADSRGTTTYTYDNQDRVTKIAVPDGQSIIYGYDPAGNRTAMATAVGTVSASNTIYAYDQDNRLASVIASGIGTIGFAYDNAGNQMQRTLPNGITILSVVVIAPNRRPAGNRTKVVEADGSATIWSYNDNAQLLGEARFDPSGTETAQTSYAYDAVGNRLSQSSGGQTTNYSYNTLDQLTSTSGAQTAQFAYDGRGNLLTATAGTSSTSYTYNAADRLTSATPSSGASSTYGYDAAGARRRRASRQSSRAFEVFMTPAYPTFSNKHRRQ